jgi:hypothetical protein
MRLTKRTMKLTSDDGAARVAVDKAGPDATSQAPQLSRRCHAFLSLREQSSDSEKGRLCVRLKLIGNEAIVKARTDRKRQRWLIAEETSGVSPACPLLRDHLQVLHLAPAR